MTQDWHIRKSQQAEGEKALVGSAFDWVLKNPGKTVLDMPPAMYSGLKNSGHLAQLASFARVEGKPEGDPAVYYRLRQQARPVELQPNRPDGRTRQAVAPAVGSSGRTAGRHPEKRPQAHGIREDQAGHRKGVVGRDRRCRHRHEGRPEAQERSRKTAAFNASLVSAMDDEERRLAGP